MGSKTGVDPIRPVAIPQAPNLARVRVVVDAISRGRATTSAIVETTSISKRHVNYLTQAAVRLGLAESKGGPLTPCGNRLLRTRVGSAAEKQVYMDAISTSPLTRDLGIDVASLQPPSRSHLEQRVSEIAPTLSAATVRHRVGDILSWRRQLDLDDPVTGPLVDGQLTLSQAPGLQRIVPDELVLNLYRSNPWWHGLPSKQLPSVRRTFAYQIEDSLEHAVAKIVLVRGPRQVGKTTAQEQMIANLLRMGVNPKHILRVQFDELPSVSGIAEPLLRVVEWYERSILEASLNQVSSEGRTTYIFLDEVQNLPNWAVQLKFLADHSDVHILVTGSSALRIEQGRDSLAGRVQTIDVGTLTLSEIAAIRYGKRLPTMLGDAASNQHLADVQFWLDLLAEGRSYRTIRDEAFRSFSDRGGYPLAHAKADAPWDLVAAQLNETVVRRVIMHDLRGRGRGRDGALLEEIFRLCCRYAGQVPSPEFLATELRQVLASNIGPERIRRYLGFLDLALLVRLIPPLELRLKKRRGPPKLCLVDHALRASWFQEIVPLTPESLRTEALSDLAGRIVESFVGATLIGSKGLNVSHLPARGDDPEVDFVITVGTKRVPIEVKYRGKLKAAHFQGLQKFMTKKQNNAPFGVLVSQADDGPAPENVLVVPLPTFLMLR